VWAVTYAARTAAEGLIRPFSLPTGMQTICIPPARGKPSTVPSGRDHLKRAFDAYGPQRSSWGIDQTNSYAKASYRQRITQFTDELSFLSESTRTAAGRVPTGSIRTYLRGVDSSSQCNIPTLRS
jgi:hypothetical protein